MEKKTWFLDYFLYSDILMKGLAVLFCSIKHYAGLIFLKYYFINIQILYYVL